MVWVLLAILTAVALAVLLRGPLREWSARRERKARERKRQWRRERDEEKERRRTERAMNRDKAAARSGPPTWQQVAQRSGSKCWLCGTRTYTDDRQRTPNGERLGATYPTVDYVLAVESGGGYGPDNVRIAHRHCAQARVKNPARTQYGTPRRSFG